LSMLTGEGSRGAAPAPVAIRSAGSVHARFAAQSEYILQRHDGQIRYRSLRSPDERPVNPFVIDRSQIRLYVPALPLGRTGSPPTHSSVIVMRAGVNHSIRSEPVRQVDVRSGITEAELQDGHAGYCQMLS